MEPPQMRPFNDAVMGQESNGNGHANPAIHIDTPEAASGKGHSHRGRYKEKFTAMREKYEKATRAQEVYQKQLELATSKIKKLQAENDLLLDVMLVNEEALFYRFFPANQSSLQRDPRPGLLAPTNHQQLPHHPPPHHFHPPPSAPPLPPPSEPQQQHQPRGTQLEREPDQRSAGTIRIGPTSSTSTSRRSSRRQQQQQQHAPPPNSNGSTHPSPSPITVHSPVGSSHLYGRFPVIQTNGRDRNSPPPHSGQHQHHHHHGPPPPLPFINGSHPNEQNSMPPPQGPYERPLEFISHDANGRV